MRTSEIIDILSQENNECVFVNEEGNGIRRFCCDIVWVDGDVIVKLTKRFLNHEWTLVPEKVDFMTVANSGKKVTPENNASRRCSIEWLLRHGQITLEQIKGKWYIEE